MTFMISSSTCIIDTHDYSYDINESLYCVAYIIWLSSIYVFGFMSLVLFNVQLYTSSISSISFVSSIHHINIIHSLTTPLIILTALLPQYWHDIYMMMIWYLLHQVLPMVPSCQQGVYSVVSIWSYAAAYGSYSSSITPLFFRSIYPTSVNASIIVIIINDCIHCAVSRRWCHFSFVIVLLLSHCIPIMIWLCSW